MRKMDITLLRAIIRGCIAIVAMIGGVVLLAMGKNAIVGTIMLAIVAYYFGWETIKRPRP